MHGKEKYLQNRTNKAGLSKSHGTRIGNGLISSYFSKKKNSIWHLKSN